MIKVFLSKVLAGFVIGAGAIIPGLSGGILAVSMGLYQPMIEAIAGFFKNVKKNAKFLLPLAIGGLLGLTIFMFLIDSLFAEYQTEIVCLFMGLVIGSVPAFFKEAKGDEPFKMTNVLYLFLGFAFAFTIVLLGSGSEGGAVAAAGREVTPLISALCGGIIILGTVLPGVSTSFILINMGVYENFLKVFTDFFSNPGYNAMLMVFALIGVVAIAVPTLLFIRKALKKFRRQSYFVLFGILVATLVGCVIQEVQANAAVMGFIEIVLCVILFAGGVIVSYFMDRAMKKLEIKEQGTAAIENQEHMEIKN